MVYSVFSVAVGNILAATVFSSIRSTLPTTTTSDVATRWLIGDGAIMSARADAVVATSSRPDRMASFFRRMRDELQSVVIRVTANGHFTTFLARYVPALSLSRFVAAAPNCL